MKLQDIVLCVYGAALGFILAQPQSIAPAWGWEPWFWPESPQAAPNIYTVPDNSEVWLQGLQVSGSPGSSTRIFINGSEAYRWPTPGGSSPFDAVSPGFVRKLVAGDTFWFHDFDASFQTCEAVGMLRRR